MSSKSSEVLNPGATGSNPSPDPEKGLCRERPSQETVHPSDEDQPPVIKDEVDGTESDKYQVNLEAEDDPKNFAVWRKWMIVFAISSGALCATSASSMVCSHAHCAGFAHLYNLSGRIR